MKLSGVLAVTFALILGIAISAPAAEEEIFTTFGDLKLLGDAPASVDLGLGAFDVFDEVSAAGQLEWRFGDKLAFIGPLGGVLANTDGGLFGYVGIYADLVAGQFVISPHTGFGAYEQGDSIDLGGVFQFYSSLTVAYRLDKRSRLGVRFGHISNADLHDKNPGTDLALLTYDYRF